MIMMTSTPIYAIDFLILCQLNEDYADHLFSNQQVCISCLCICNCMYGKNPSLSLYFEVYYTSIFLLSTCLRVYVSSRTRIVSFINRLLCTTTTNILVFSLLLYVSTKCSIIIIIINYSLHRIYST